MSAALDRTLGALADPQRRRVVELLRERPRRAGELARAAGLSAPTASRHLRVLRDAALVEADGEGGDARVRVYSLKSEGMDELKHWLAETERMWAEQLAAFKHHVEEG